MLETWNKILNIHIRTINDLVARLGTVCKAYEKSRKEISDIGFNVFKLSSDLYYRENFHSDIIKAFLDPYGKHKQTNLYLNLFVEMLGLNTTDFEFSTVLREQNNIDILIVNKNSCKAIIIENKINNAGDRFRQLPRYLDIVRKKYEVAAIVYIPLDSSKWPDRFGWDENDKKEVDRLLHIIPVYCNSGNVNLVDHWITPSMLKSNDIDCMFILRQYGRLIKHLNTSIMDMLV